MTSTPVRPFRFGYQLRGGDLEEVIAEAQAAEAAGFDVVTMPDHVGVNVASPMIVLAAVARETERIRLGTFVLNNEMRNPVQLAWEAATLDRISGGRFELGIGAGHTPHEFAATGEMHRPAKVRKQRLAESVDVIRRLFDGETVDHQGEHYEFNGASIEPPAQHHLPIMVAGNGDALLAHAGRHADIIGLNGLGKTLADGHRHSVKFGEDWLGHQIATVAEHAGVRDQGPELNALVQRVVITDDRAAAAEETQAEISGVTAEELLATPYVAIGTHEEIAADFRRLREAWGISYFVTRDIEAMEQIMPLARD